MINQDICVTNTSRGFQTFCTFPEFHVELLTLFPTNYTTQRCGNVVVKYKGEKKNTLQNYISPMCHLHFTSNSLPRIISVTESGRMQLQVVLKLLWGGINILTAWKPAFLSLLWWDLVFKDTLWCFGLVSRTVVNFQLKEFSSVK